MVAPYQKYEVRLEFDLILNGCWLLVASSAPVQQGRTRDCQLPNMRQKCDNGHDTTSAIENGKSFDISH